MTKAFSLVALLALTGYSNIPGDLGFAGHPLDCARGIYHADCAPDSAAMQQVAARDQADDAQCQSYGLQFGTPAYAQCRQNIIAQRTNAAIGLLQATRPSTMPAYQCPTGAGSIMDGYNRQIAAQNGVYCPPPAPPPMQTCNSFGSDINGMTTSTTTCY